MADTEHQKWIKDRSWAVRKAYNSYDCLHEFGFGETLVDTDTAVQMSCPFHGPDRRPSARYYPSSSRYSDYVRCYYCKENWDSVNLYMKFKGLSFMDALKELERRFRIKIPKRPDAEPIEDYVDRNLATYKSDAWGDVERNLVLLNKKLLRVRDCVSLIDYIKYCRVLDKVRWDLDHMKGQQTPEMVEVLARLKTLMDDSIRIKNAIDDNFN